MQRTVRGRRRERQPIIISAAVCILALAHAGRAIAADDSTMCDHIQRELERDSSINSAQIDVSCLAGVVTLHGTVDKLLAKDRAVRQAEAVRGVKSVVNLINVHPPRPRLDAAISADVASALLSNPATDAFEVEVHVDAGMVTLTGSVGSWREKQLCTQVAKEVAGVMSLENRLAVEIGESRSDQELESEIRQAMKRDVFFSGADIIKVSVENGLATLSGTVGTAFERRRATELASTYGVSRVDASDLEVDERTKSNGSRRMSAPDLTDSEVENAIQAALYRDPRVSGSHVNISVEDGYVTLRGVVDNLQARRAAEQDAHNTRGVAFVNNRLKVDPQSTPPAAAIQQSVEDALSRNTYTDEADITVAVFNGVANLYGTVGTQVQKSVAEDVAARVTGVRVVDNKLVVINRSAPAFYDPYVDGYEPYWTPRMVYPYDYPYPVPLTISDAELERRIEDEIHWSPIVDAQQIIVSVDHGRVALTGIVDSRAESQAAVENALEAGALYVENSLVIR